MIVFLSSHGKYSLTGKQTSIISPLKYTCSCLFTFPLFLLSQFFIFLPFPFFPHFSLPYYVKSSLKFFPDFQLRKIIGQNIYPCIYIRSQCSLQTFYNIVINIWIVKILIDRIWFPLSASTCAKFPKAPSRSNYGTLVSYRPILYKTSLLWLIKSFLFLLHYFLKCVLQS